MLLLALSAAPAQAEPDVAATWHLDEVSPTATTPDATGNGFDGRQVAGTPASGRFGSGLDLASAGHGFLVSSGPLLEPASVTAMAWVRRMGTPGQYRTILGKGALGCSDSTFAIYTGQNGGLQFYVSPEGAPIAVTPATEPAAIWDGQWHAVAGTFDATTRATTLWIDGQAAGTVEATGGALNYAGFALKDFAVGRYPDSGCALAGFQFTGSIDEPRVYGRALSADELAFLQAPDATAPRVLPDPTPSPGPATPTPAPAAVPPASVSVPGTSDAALTAALEEALAAADLAGAMADPFATTRVTAMPAPGAKRVEALSRRLASLTFGIPVVLPGASGGYYDVAGVLAIARRRRVVRLELPAVVVPAGPSFSVAVLPIDAAARTELTKSDVSAAAIEILAQKLDEFGDLTAEKQQRLQMYMQPFSQSLTTLSNLLKKLNEVSRTIIGNIKSAPLLAETAASRKSRRRRRKARALRQRAAKAARRLALDTQGAAQVLAPAAAPELDPASRATFALPACSKRCRYAIPRR